MIFLDKLNKDVYSAHVHNEAFDLEANERKNVGMIVSNSFSDELPIDVTNYIKAIVSIQTTGSIDDFDVDIVQIVRNRREGSGGQTSNGASRLVDEKITAFEYDTLTRGFYTEIPLFGTYFVLRIRNISSSVKTISNTLVKLV